jgi:Chaperone for flagella basal body P-ring formation
MLTRSLRHAVWLLAFSTAALVTVGAQTGTNKDRSPISREQVAESLRSAGIETNRDQFHTLSNATAVPGALLHVVKLKKESAGTLLAEMACQESSECLPFYVRIQQPAVAANAASSLLELHVNSGTAKHKVEHPLVVRGQPVTLVMEKTNVRIMLSAICMEGGMPGQTIRVSSPDRKRIYTAEVVSHNMVRGTL